MKLTLCIDKQPKTNPSNELKTYEINIGNRLCSYDDVYDELIITLNDVNQLEGIIKRRCNIDRFDIITKLQEEYIQTLEIPEITLFEGTNYVYLQEFDYLNMKIEYLTNVEMNKHFVQTEEFKSTLVLTSQEFNLRLSQKLDGEEFTHASIVAKINDDTSEMQIEADKVNIEANDILNILAGIAINMKAKQISMYSDNFSVDAEGNTIMRNATITGGSIELSGDASNPKFIIKNISDDTRYTQHLPNTIRMFRDGISTIIITNTTPTPQIALVNANDSTERTNITSAGITTPTVTQTSKEEYKKNFERLVNAKEILENTDIYKYNLKSDEDTDKKNIGFVIGDKFNYSEEITSKDNNGVNIYSMVSVLWQVVKEQEEEIKLLKERIDK